MSDIKCPFCHQELETGNYYVHCHNPECNITVEMEGTEEMWEALIRTRKALDVAVDALEKIESTKWYDSMSSYEEMTFTAMKALEQITALEQKDVK